MNTIPQHIGIIIDGNRRRAVQRVLEPFEGHLAGAETLKNIIEIVFKKGIKVLTIYGFSTENRKRSQPEVDALMKIFTEYLIEMDQRLLHQQIQVNILGDTSKFNEELQQAITTIQENTKNKSDYIFNLCLNYGGRDDIVHSFRTLLKKLENQEIQREDINEENISKHLYTSGQPDPDLIIRTSGEQRLSNFLTRQSAYSELLFINTLRPDFDENILKSCLQEFQNRKRRFGE